LPDEQAAASSSAGGAAGSSGAPGAGSAGERSAASQDPVVAAYRRALRLVRDRQFGEALGALQDFVRSHPDHPFADNATYWVGEVHYAARRYDQALQTFGRVVSEYPEGNKVADALFKMALCHKRTGDLQKAAALLERVQRQYPDTIAARMASREDTP
jgi:tol-pal system protein YbgF